MINIPQLNRQNDKIRELSSVLQYLISNKEMCKTEVTCDLFLQYSEEVIDHLCTEEKEVYSQLLNHQDLKIRNTTKDFFSGSIEIKRIFNNYFKRWCKNKALRITEYAPFVKDSQEIFNLVLNRIDAETNILYPLVENTLNDRIAA